MTEKEDQIKTVTDRLTRTTTFICIIQHDNNDIELIVCNLSFHETLELIYRAAHELSVRFLDTLASLIPKGSA